jgi:GR25 family glycosyltransferase involved in LPS biosynthesis
MVRNRNITASHYLLWRKALDSSASWTLICEDDVALRSQLFEKELVEIVDFLGNDEESNRPLALFLSQSFSLETHGLANSSLHVTHVGEQQLIESHDFGWSDTVAATVYSRGFLELLVDYFDRLSEATLATIPVDWLVDLAICELFHETPLRTVHLIPGLCIQQSLQP